MLLLSNNYGQTCMYIRQGYLNTHFYKSDQNIKAHRYFLTMKICIIGNMMKVYRVWLVLR